MSTLIYLEPRDNPEYFFRQLIHDINTNFSAGTSGSGGGSPIQNGLNTYTGGTVSAQTINVSALTINNIYVSGGSLFNTISGTSAFISNANSTTYTSAQTGTLLHIISNGSTNGRISLDTYAAANTFGAVFQGRKARGTNTAPSAALKDDTLALIGGDGYGTTNFHGSSIGAFLVKAEQTLTDTSAPTYLSFFVTPTGSTASTEKWRISSNGNLSNNLTAGTAIFTIKNASGNTESAQNLFEGQNSGGTITSFIRADGSMSAVTLSASSVYADNLLTKSLFVTASTTTAIVSVGANLVNCSFTALTSSLTIQTTGTANNFDKMVVRIKDNGTARAITFDSTYFEAKGQALPTTTVISKVLTVGFIYDSITGKFGCVSVAQEI